MILRVLESAIGTALVLWLLSYADISIAQDSVDPVQLGDYMCDQAKIEVTFLPNTSPDRAVAGIQFAVNYCLKYGETKKAPCLLSLEEVSKGQLTIKCHKALGKALPKMDAGKEKVKGGIT